MQIHRIFLIFLMLFTASCMEEPSPIPESLDQEVIREMGKL